MKYLYFRKSEHILICEGHNRQEENLPMIEVRDMANCVYCFEQKPQIRA